MPHPGKGHRRGRRGRPEPEEGEVEEAAEHARSEEAELRDQVDELMGTKEEIPPEWHETVERGISNLLGVSKRKGAEERKTMDEVFDKQTLLTLFKFISNGLVETLDYPISTGKEANVFHATRPDGEPIAVKIFRTNTATFRAHITYIEGDPRFGKIGRDLRDIVHVWASKEYKNLERYFEAGVRVPQPIAHRHNVLVMEYVGVGGFPAPRLKDALPEDPEAAYDVLVEDYAKGFEADLVHGDFSEFNILNREEDLFTIDVAQAVLVRHPLARELLERDARNLARFFLKLGVEKATFENTLAGFRAKRDKKQEALQEEANR